ncbi:hypothetical protein ABKA04_006612 [Annulohypoxylon sp. FPYF3050]
MTTQNYFDLLWAPSSTFGGQTYDIPSLTLFAAFVILVPYFLSLLQTKHGPDDIPVVNRLSSFQPKYLSQLRWAFQSEKIMKESINKFEGRPWRLARGDKEVVVLPTSFIPELNKLPSFITNSRGYHSDNVISGLVDIDVVRITDHHVKILLSRISPAIPQLLQPTAQRTEATIDRLFPQHSDEWKVTEPLKIVVECVSEGIALALVGPEISNRPHFVETLVLHTKLIFTTTFIMRFVPNMLKPIFIWLLPSKWQLRHTWKYLDDNLLPEIIRQQQENSTYIPHPNLLSFVVKDERNTVGGDPYLLSKLVAAVAAGGTYSTANLATGVIIDLTGQPEFLEEIRQEIAEQHKKCNGNWDLAAFNSLDKLESAMKETSRLAPSSLIVCGRNIHQDHTLSNGLLLKKGDSIGVAYFSKSMDPRVFDNSQDYNGKRFYEKGIEELRTHPFRGIDGEILTWGAGRYACPGRFIANLAAKITLVKIIDEYDFKLIEGKRPRNVVLHDFKFVHPNSQLLMRRREKTLGIKYN